MVKPVEQELVLEETHHYFACREDKVDDSALGRLSDWLFEQSGAGSVAMASGQDKLQA